MVCWLAPVMLVRLLSVSAAQLLIFTLARHFRQAGYLETPPGLSTTSPRTVPDSPRRQGQFHPGIETASGSQSDRIRTRSAALTDVTTRE